MSLVFRVRHFLLLIFLSVCAVVHPQPAQAAMQLCNRTSYILYAATGFQSGAEMVTQGWTRIAPGACQTALPQPLSGSYYLLARTSQAHNGPARTWGGAAQLCVKEGNFSLKTPFGAPGCGVADSYSLPFALVNTHKQKSWTTTFTESAAINSMDAARVAGTKRLLADVGYKIGPLNTKPDKKAAAALVQFRARMKLAANATAEDLFDALETEALKMAAPTGYSICNDTNEPLWAAIGLKSGANWISRGWWNVAAGACAKATTTPLSGDVYLLAEKQNGQRLVSGKANFCVTGIPFEVQGRDHCARGLSAAGFAEIKTKSAQGYAAHIGDQGLVGAPMQAQAATPK
ncbi:MAG TPA: DUF1036 domain-containing protein [Rhizomicrobium sp.]|jgi:uncharacterized membrane protein|nr:DUF1036 domain-containing protein [Rhizomicrobium sp.]